MEPSLPACKLLITSGGIFGLLRMEGGKFINPDPISETCPPGNDPAVRCSALRAFSPSGSYNTHRMLNATKYSSKSTKLKRTTSKSPIAIPSGSYY